MSLSTPQINGMWSLGRGCALRLHRGSAQDVPVQRESSALYCTAVAPTIGEGRGGSADAVSPLFHRKLVVIQETCVQHLSA